MHPVRRIFDLARKVPGGRWLYSRLVGLYIPYTGSIGADVVDLGPGFAQLRLTDRRAVRNHLDSVHALAIANLGELTTGLSLMASVPAKARSILKHLEVDYRRKARGTLTSRAEAPTDLPPGRHEVPITAEIRDAANQVVATVTASWVVEL
jgi:acyl-coenzyme A thioesterase PaaI-like protein